VELLKVAGLQPNCVTFNELMDAVIKTNPDSSWSLLDDMYSLGVKPNHITCSILLKSIKAKSTGNRVERILEILDNMDESMDEVLLSSVVEACIRVGRTDLLIPYLKKQKSFKKVQIRGPHTYGSIIRAYGFVHDISGAWDTWREMRKMNILPSAITLGCMVEALVNNGDTEGAYDLIHQVQEDTDCRSVLNSIVYCSLLKGFTREKKVDRVWTVYEEMKKMSAEVSIVTFNTLIDASARCGNMERLNTILQDMKTQGAKPNLITYSTMLKGHCQSGDMQSGFKIMEQIRNDPELKPDEIMYNSLLDGCAQNNLVTEAFELLTQMQAEGIPPSNFTLSILVKLMNRARRLDQAFALVRDITSKYNFQPNVHVYTNLVQACVFNQQLPRAMSILDEMISKKVAPDGRTYSILIRANMTKGLFEQAAGLIKGALGLPDAPPSLQQPLARCSTLDYGLINETLSTIADRGHAKDVAVPLLTSIRQSNSKVRIDQSTQRKVMSPCIGSKGW